MARHYGIAMPSTDVGNGYGMKYLLVIMCRNVGITVTSCNTSAFIIRQKINYSSAWLHFSLSKKLLFFRRVSPCTLCVRIVCCCCTIVLLRCKQSMLLPLPLLVYNIKFYVLSLRHLDIHHTTMQVKIKQVILIIYCVMHCARTIFPVLSQSLASYLTPFHFLQRTT